MPADRVVEIYVPDKVMYNPEAITLRIDDLRLFIDRNNRVADWVKFTNPISNGRSNKIKICVPDHMLSNRKAISRRQTAKRCHTIRIKTVKSTPSNGQESSATTTPDFDPFQQMKLVNRFADSRIRVLRRRLARITKTRKF